MIKGKAFNKTINFIYIERALGFSLYISVYYTSLLHLYYIVSCSKHFMASIIYRKRALISLNVSFDTHNCETISRSIRNFSSNFHDLKLTQFDQCLIIMITRYSLDCAHRCTVHP